MNEYIQQGSTPTHEFELPFPTDLVANIVVTYEQDDTIVIEKKGSEVEYDGYFARVSLTQAETLKLQYGKMVKIQLKVKTKEDEVIPSEIIYRRVSEVLNKEIL
jgi:hypothetical protein